MKVKRFLRNKFPSICVLKVILVLLSYRGVHFFFSITKLNLFNKKQQHKKNNRELIRKTSECVHDHEFHSFASYLDSLYI